MIDRFVEFDPEPRESIHLDQRVKLLKELSRLHDSLSFPVSFSAGDVAPRPARQVHEAPRRMKS